MSCPATVSSLHRPLSSLSHRCAIPLPSHPTTIPHSHHLIPPLSSPSHPPTTLSCHCPILHCPAITPSCLVTVLSHHRPGTPTSSPATIVSRHCATSPQSHSTTISSHHHELSVTSPPPGLTHSGPCSLPSPSQSCQGRGQRDHTQVTRVPSCLGPPPCATRFCHTGSCCPCPLHVPPQHHHPPPSFGCGNCMLHVPSILSHVPTCVPAGQGGLALPPEPVVPPSCRRSRGARVPPPSSPFGF